MVYAWRLTQRRKNQQSQETDGFRFAITLIVALTTGLLTVYNYFQNTAVDNILYAFVSGFIPVALLLLFLVAYIFIKGYSMEVQETKHKEYLDQLASSVYLITLLMFLMVLTFVLGVFTLVFFRIEPTNFISAIIILISICISIILEGPRIKSQPKEKILYSIIIIVVVLAYGVLFWLVLFSPANSPFQGHVKIDMDIIYYKNGAPIPVSIQVTGPNTGLVVILDKEDSEHNLSSKDKIEMKPERSPDKTINSTYLTGNALDFGKYMVFINTTNLTEGYYELISVRPVYDKISAVKSFYLLNNSRNNISNNFITNISQ